MKTLHLITIVILCIALLSSSMVFVTMPQRAYASDCGIKETTLTIPQFYRVSDAVFVGTISSIQSYANHQWMVKFDTEKIWKGTPSPKITIITGNIQACGYSLVQGEKYLIFANGSPLDYISWFSRPYADAQPDIAIFDDPQFQAQEKYKEELNKKLEAAKDAISNLMGSRMGDIPFNMVGVDVINSTLEVGIDSTKATLSEEAYLKKIKEIVGDIPIKITFGQIVADVGDSSNNIPRKDLPSLLLSPLKQFKSGIAAKDVQCNEDLQLVVRQEDGSPACVKPETLTKLVLWNWAQNPLPDFFNKFTSKEKNELFYKVMNLQGIKDWSKTGWRYIGADHVFSDVTGAELESTINLSLPPGMGNPPLHCPDSRGWFARVDVNMTTLDIINVSFPDVKTASCEKPHGGPVLLNNQTESVKTLPASFLPCDTPFSQSNAGVAVLYMPMNSIGKICVQYSNSNPPQPAGIRAFEAHHIMEDAKDVTSYATPDTIQRGESTVVYTIKTASHSGFYGLTIFCVGMPFAVGYDSSSTFVTGDFPFLSGTYNCPAELYEYHIVGLSGIGVKYMQ